MKLQSKLALVSAMMAALLVPAMMPVASAINAIGEVTIQRATCGLTTASGNPINYGTLIVGATSEEQTLVLENLGNTPGDLLISGENWKAAPGGPIAGDVMSVGTTHYSPTSPSLYTEKRVLTDTPVTVVGEVTPGVGNGKPIYFQLQPELLPSASSFSGDATQILTLTADC